MFCPKCGKEIPDDSQFCLKCGHTLTTNTAAPMQPTQKKSGFSALGIIGAVVVLLAIVVLWTRNRTPLIPSNSPFGASPTAPAPAPVIVPMSTKLFTGQTIINAGQYVTKTITVEPGMQGFRVTGSFNASGGLTNDIQAVISDEAEFQNWINGHQAKVFYSSGPITHGTVEVGPLAPGRYIMGFSNTKGLVGRQVFAEVDARWTVQR